MPTPEGPLSPRPSLQGPSASLPVSRIGLHPLRQASVTFLITVTKHKKSSLRKEGFTVALRIRVGNSCWQTCEQQVALHPWARGTGRWLLLNFVSSLCSVQNPRPWNWTTLRERLPHQITHSRKTHRPEGSQDLIKLPTNINHQKTFFFFPQGLQGQFLNASHWEISQHEVTAASTEVSFPSPQPSALDSEDLCHKTSVLNMSDQDFSLKHPQHFRSPSKRGASPPFHFLCVDFGIYQQ